MLSEETGLTCNPAVKILDFYEGLVSGKEVRLDTKETARASPTLAGLGPVRKAWMEDWVEQWSLSVLPAL